jgi:hypothetical protein
LSGARFELSASWILACALISAHAAAAAAVIVAMPRAIGIALAAGLGGLGLASAWSRALLKAAKSVRAIEIDSENVVLELANGERFSATLAQRRYVSRFFVTLQVTQPLRRTLLVTRDMLDADLFRRLRIWALWSRMPGVAAAQLRP